MRVFIFFCSLICLCSLLLILAYMVIPTIH
jgi:hypothetical protein